MGPYPVQNPRNGRCLTYVAVVSDAILPEVSDGELLPDDHRRTKANHQT